MSDNYNPQEYLKIWWYSNWREISNNKNNTIIHIIVNLLNGYDDAEKCIIKNMWYVRGPILSKDSIFWSYSLVRPIDIINKKKILCNIISLIIALSLLTFFMKFT